MNSDNHCVFFSYWEMYGCMCCGNLPFGGNCFMMVYCCCILGECKVQVLSLRHAEEVRVN